MKTEVSKVLFIVNKYAGAGYRPSVEGEVIKACKERDIEYTITFTEGRGHATDVALQVASAGTFSAVVAVGGDGTVNEVARGLLHSSTPLGIIPNGSGNGLARHLRIPMDISRALRSFFSSHLIRMDTFLLNEHLSLNVSGLGFDGHIANLFSVEKKRGLQGYVRHALRESMRFGEFDAEIITVENTTHVSSFVIAIANSSQYGNNARIAPAASVCDGILHVSILKKIPFYRIDFFYDFFTGRINRTMYCKTLETDQFMVRLKTPIPYHVDGEPGGKSDSFTIKILPASLSVFCPKETLNP